MPPINHIYKIPIKISALFCANISDPFTQKVYTQIIIYAKTPKDHPSLYISKTPKITQSHNAVYMKNPKEKIPCVLRNTGASWGWRYP